MVHYRGGAAAIDPAVYPDEDAFWGALSAAYASQVRGIAAAGCTYLQLDDTSLAYLNDPAERAELAAQGRDAEHQRGTPRRWSGGNCSRRRRTSTRWSRSSTTRR
jgi:5-methyltetrahydropteroyltriglutamate--homocysteine methyltransferase